VPLQSGRKNRATVIGSGRAREAAPNLADSSKFKKDRGKAQGWDSVTPRVYWKKNKERVKGREKKNSTGGALKRGVQKKSKWMRGS